MQKTKRTSPKKTSVSPQEQEEALTLHLCALARDLAKIEARPAPAFARISQQNDLQKLIRKCLIQKKDDILYEAIERTKDIDTNACRLLKESIEEAAEIIVFKRDDGTELEVNAFVIPLFAHIHGGLQREQCFQDQEAFESLRNSLQEAQLESDRASVVLVSHAYHLDEIDGIRYSQINAMVREAFHSMTGKKAAAMPALERSMSGWPGQHFAPQDLAVELRFLLGFTLKSMDDPFYQVPEDETAAERYFDMRAERFRLWTKQVEPLVKRCLVTSDTEIDLHFLYQDLFHGGKERGLAEYATLEMMAELHHGLQVHGTQPGNTRAVIGPVEIGGEMVLRVNLYAAENGALAASAEKPVGMLGDMTAEAEDVCDALITIGVQSLALAAGFDAEGQALDVQPCEVQDPSRF